MSSPVMCGAEGSVIHTALARPIVGALICATLAGGGLLMKGSADQFGGCGEVGGDLYQVTETYSEVNAVCAVPKEPPTVYKK